MKKSILVAGVWLVAFMGASALWQSALAQTDGAKPALARASAPAGAAFSWPRRPFLAIDSIAHTGKAMHIALTPDDARAVTAAYDGTVRVWDVQSGELLQRFSLPKSADNGALLRGLALSPDGLRVAVSGYNMLPVPIVPVVPVIAPEASPAALAVEDAPATMALSASAVSLEELPPS